MTSALEPLAGSFIVSSDGIYMPIWPKDPNDVADYTLYWTNWLMPGETVAAVKYTILSGELSILSDNFGDDYTTAWHFGGVANTNYPVSALMTTSKGRQFERTYEIACGQN